MEKAAELHRIIAPELTALLEERYALLRQIECLQPVGRRALAAALGMGERVVRAQVDFLKEAGLIDFSPLGMTMTGDGQAILPELSEYVRILHGLAGLESGLAAALGLRLVIVIRGDSDADAAVRRELGRAAAGVLRQHLGDNMTIAVSGGSTMAQVADAINFTASATTVVPARGGLGERVEYQSNTIAAGMANKLGGRYRLLHIPDGVSEEAMDVLVSHDLHLRDVSQLIRRADVLLCGIGRADAMALRRGMDPAMVERLKANGAAGESLGHYCALTGKVVHTTRSLGLRLEDLAGVKHVIAVAGGRQKAEAIVAVTAAGGQDILITDEAAAKAIQEIIKK
ncbi:MAG TPA: sugar-binding domain-containing protein [Selenomonadales bacterium]|nr:sugar-binding domain-containing protein [Selenomonadales bacterium]